MADDVSNVAREIVGPVLCSGCARKVSWWKVDGIWRLRNYSDRTPHRCAA